MPRKDGIAAAQELMSLYPEQERPEIIALTANAAGEDRQNCLAVGMTNYIAKPILPADLARVLLGLFHYTSESRVLRDISMEMIKLRNEKAKAKRKKRIVYYIYILIIDYDEDDE